MLLTAAISSLAFFKYCSVQSLKLLSSPFTCCFNCPLIFDTFFQIFNITVINFGYLSTGKPFPSPLQSACQTSRNTDVSALYQFFLPCQLVHYLTAFQDDCTRFECTSNRNIRTVLSASFLRPVRYGCPLQNGLGTGKTL